MNRLLSSIRKELKENVDLKYKKTSHGFYKEEIKLHGVRSVFTKKISQKYFQENKHFSKEEIFNICEELLKSNYIEEKGIAFNWLFRIRKQYTKKDFKVFESWLKKYVTNWSDCDDFCTHAFGELFLQFPEIYTETRKWVKSRNMWVRRASAVIMIYPTRHSDRFLKENFEIADRLFFDSEDLVQKAYGWMLKEASKKYQQDVFKYVVKNKDKMSRTALRYAIEKMPADLKNRAMKK